MLYGTIWKHIMDSDILYKKHINGISKNLDIHKTQGYFVNTQKKEGYFNKESPMIYATYHFCGILYCLGELPSKNTIDYIKSLQVGSIGFSETTGEMAWTDKSYMAVQLCSWFNIDIERKDVMVKYFKDYQNGDGGFGSIISGDTNFDDTIYSIRILDHLSSRPDNIEGAIGWLISYGYHSLWELFHYLKTLETLGYKLSKEEKKAHIFELQKYKKGARDFRGKYYYNASLQLLDQPLPYHSQMRISNNEINNHYLARNLKMLGEIDKFKQELLSYARKNELPQGGFLRTTQSIIANGFMINSLNLIDSLDAIDKDRFVSWLKSAGSKHGWGGQPHQREYHEYTVSSLIALRLCGNSNVKNHQEILRKAYQQMEEAICYSRDFNYYVLRTIKNSLEKMMLLNAKPPSLLKICNKVMEYYCRQGGFGSKNRPYLYATLWGVRTLFLSERYMGLSKRIFVSKLNKIRVKTSNWIRKCQNKDGGFGPIPGQPSNIQSTFCAHYCLWMLNEKPKDVVKAIEWLVSLQKDDGGFAGSKEMGSEMLHVFYVIGSLAILSMI